MEHIITGHACPGDLYQIKEALIKTLKEALVNCFLERIQRDRRIPTLAKAMAGRQGIRG